MPGHGSKVIEWSRGLKEIDGVKAYHWSVLSIYYKFVLLEYRFEVLLFLVTQFLFVLYI